MTADTAPRATVLITTRNRRDELRGALTSALEQSVAVEVLVIDDGSTDGTSEMVRREFPRVRLIRREESRGYIACRNHGTREARTNFIFSIDDDARFSNRDAVRRTLDDFDGAVIGAVALPYIDVERGPEVRQQAPDAHRAYVTGRYIGTAHAVRRDVFLRLGGYREHFVHQGEEGDFCLRMLAAGFLVRLGTADPVHHLESPRRDFSRMDYYGARNTVLFTWHNVPFPEVLIHMPAVVARCLALTFEPRRLWTRVTGLAEGLRMCFTAARQPVSRETYRLARSLASRPMTLDEARRLLPFPEGG